MNAKYIIESFFANRWSKLDGYEWDDKDTAKGIYTDLKHDFPNGKFQLVEIKRKVIA
jgi:hypothetical protein